MRKIVFVSMLVLLAVLLSACGGSAAAPVEDHSSSEDMKIVLSSNPSPAMMGDVELLLTITDKDGNPVEGAEVKISADHTDMSGMGMSGQATEQGGGKYSIKANFSDSGDWVLTVSVHKDGVDHEEDIDFQVQ